MYERKFSMKELAIQTNMRSKVRRKEILSLLAGPKLQNSIL